MSRIRLLPKHIAEKIAAGEVVERPASVVKELLENAIDAGASIINLEIKNGGVRFIRVADNGVGISAADVPTAVLRHATSKIYEEEDLEAIGTLGFRGEALASITAVSKVEIITRTADELEGNRIVFHGGERIEQGPAGCPKGTTIVVRDLFYNTPARMKFLKKDVTEAHAVRAVVERLALSHPEISFGFLKDGRKEMQTPGDNRLIAAIHAVLGREFAQNLLPVKYELGGVSVSGFVLKPVSARSNRTMQFFFLNGRLVRSRTAVAALEQAYKGSIMVGRFPGCVLHITLSSALVDVNVHPAKTEVRFANEKSVFEAIYYAVKTTIAEKDPRPSLKLETPETHEAPSAQLEDSLPVLNKGVQLLFSAPVEKQSVFHMDPAVVYTPVSHEASGTLPKTSSVPSTSEQMNMEVKKENTCSLEKAPDEKQVVEESSFGAQRSFRVVGQCFTTYILVEQGDTLYMIDKHAAHERLLYEELKKKRSSAAQMLLSPHTVTLSREEYAAIMENKPLLKDAGFEVDDFGGLTILVRAAPTYLREEDIVPTVEEIAGKLIVSKKEVLPDRMDWLFHSIACRAAIKAGDKTGAEEAQQLAERVLALDDVRYCPHGRPVAFVLTKKEIEKQFGRLG